MRSPVAPWLGRSLGEGGCAKHNLEKSDKILAIAPWIFVGNAAAAHIQKLVS
jgi:hypothetical protein